LTTKPAEELDGRIAAAFSDAAKSGDAARLLAEVKEATSAAELAAETARKHALDPLMSGDDLKLARREMDDAAFKQDRLQEASAKLAERVEALKALEADRRMWEEHERVLDERDRLAEEMEHMADSIAQIAHLVRQIEACDREIGRLNATSAAKFGHIRIVLSGAAPAVATLFQDAVVWDAFIAVAGLKSPPVVSGWAGAKDKLHAKRSAAL
jgi:predicted metal-dependent hydrolase